MTEIDTIIAAAFTGLALFGGITMTAAIALDSGRARMTRIKRFALWFLVGAMLAAIGAALVACAALSFSI